MEKDSTLLVDQMFEREPEDEVNVASFVKDIAKIGYHPIFYTNIGMFQGRPGPAPLAVGKHPVLIKKGEPLEM